MNSSRYDALLAFVLAAQTVSAHGVSFATTRLSIGKDADIVAIEEACDEMLHLIVDFNLGAHL